MSNQTNILFVSFLLEVTLFISFYNMKAACSRHFIKRRENISSSRRNRTMNDEPSS